MPDAKFDPSKPTWWMRYEQRTPPNQRPLEGEEITQRHPLLVLVDMQREFPDSNSRLLTYVLVAPGRASDEDAIDLTNVVRYALDFNGGEVYPVPADEQRKSIAVRAVTS